ncbi:MAG: hypothetical protein QG649_377 [Patescibacteria group bacterium]|jgi:hypothetical protein|nr:hypothetical protein [Patescibacteria group bacterium]
MTLDIVQSITLLVTAFLAIAILLKILAVVHKQARHVKDLELRMKAMEQVDADSLAAKQDTMTEYRKG